MIDPMTQEEIVAAREWIGLSEEQISDAELVDGVQNSLWLFRLRFRKSLSELVSSVMAAAMADFERAREKMMGGSDGSK